MARRTKKNTEKLNQLDTVLDYLRGPHVKNVVIERAVIADFEGNNREQVFIIRYKEATILGEEKTNTRRTHRARRKSTA